MLAKTRALAAKRWKSGLDAWSGFNQMKATERAQRLLQIITSFRPRQWTVLPLGISNGPSFFQEAMLGIFQDRVEAGSSLEDLDAMLEYGLMTSKRGRGP